MFGLCVGSPAVRIFEGVSSLTCCGFPFVKLENPLEVSQECVRDLVVFARFCELCRCLAEEVLEESTKCRRFNARWPPKIAGLTLCNGELKVTSFELEERLLGAAVAALFARGDARARAPNVCDGGSSGSLSGECLWLDTVGEFLARLGAQEQKDFEVLVSAESHDLLRF